MKIILAFISLLGKRYIIKCIFSYCMYTAYIFLRNENKRFKNLIANVPVRLARGQCKLLYVSFESVGCNYNSDESTRGDIERHNDIPALVCHQ